MLVLTLLPSVFLTPFLGVLIDRFNKIRIAYLCNLVRFIVILIIPISYFLGVFSDSVFFVSIFFSYICWYILEPTKESILKNILPNHLYKDGISTVQGAWQVGLLSSAILAGLLMDYFGIYKTILYASFTYIIAFLLLIFVGKYTSSIRDSEVSSSNKGYLNEFTEGWSYLFKNKQVLYFVLTTSAVLPYLYAINALIDPFNYEMLNGSGTTLGIIDSGAGFGSLLSAVFYTILVGNRRIILCLLTSILLLSIFTTLFSFTNTTNLALLAYV